MNKTLKEIIKHEILSILKEDKRSDLISKIRQEAIENDTLIWFVNKYDHGFPNDETRAAVIEFGMAEDAFWYTTDIDGHPRDDTRNAVLSNPYYSYFYAKDIDKSPRDDTRNAVLISPKFSCEYARYVDEKLRDDTRNAAWEDEKWGRRYDKHFNL